MSVRLPEDKQVIMHCTDVYLMGCKGTLYDMHREGWDVAVDMRHDMRALQVVLRHRPSSSYALSQLFDMDLLGACKGWWRESQGGTWSASGMQTPRMQMRVTQMVADATIRIQTDMRSWKNTEVIMAQTEDVQLSGLSLFGEGEAEPVIIKPQSVPELMDQILKLQEPNQAEIRKKIQRERRQVKQQAQIISIAG